MKKNIIIIFLICSYSVKSQTTSRMPDSVRRIVDDYNGVRRTLPKAKTTKIQMTEEEFIKEKLINLSLSNELIKAAEANIIISEIARKKANTSLLNSVTLGANINEFAITNSVVATLLPRYNLGLSVPLDLFAKNKAEKNTADQVIKINNFQKKILETNLKAKVLLQYEIYLEKLALLQYQKIAIEDNVADYETAQKSFKDASISLDELNKIYRGLVAEKAILATKEKELNVSIIQLEEIIGVPLKSVLIK